jgi:DNA mismatch endonuclease (patch repair protein)
MSRIKNKDTKPELLVRKFLYARGMRYRLHDKNLPGKPDIVIRRLKTVIFVNGCFWHGHENCKYFIIPVTRKKWWLDKINDNKQRDVKNLSLLTKLGWKTYIIFECELKKHNLLLTLNSLVNKINS